MKSAAFSFKSLKLATASVVLLVAGTLAFNAYAERGAYHHHGGMPAFGGPHMVKMVDRMLDVVKATDAQRAQVKQITQAAAADLKAQHEARRNLRQQWVQAFTQPTVDPNAVESLRQQQLAVHDQASKRMAQAMLDVSSVLTPEQRKQLAEHLQKRHDMMKRHMRERHELDGPTQR